MKWIGYRLFVSPVVEGPKKEIDEGDMYFIPQELAAELEKLNTWNEVSQPYLQALAEKVGVCWLELPSILEDLFLCDDSGELEQEYNQALSKAKEDYEKVNLGEVEWREVRSRSEIPAGYVEVPVPPKMTGWRGKI